MSNAYKYIALIFLVSINNQSYAQTVNCYNYEPDKVILCGKIVKQVFPSSPNYDSLNKSDKKDTCWILTLKKYICIAGKKDNDIDVFEKDIKNVQLIFLENSFNKYHKMLNQKVLVSGSLTHQISGHHHTKILFIVNSIDRKN
jgi:hypothetical protein